MNKMRGANLEEVKSNRERSKETKGGRLTTLAGMAGGGGPTRNTIGHMKSGSDRSGTMIHKKKVETFEDDQEED